ncbi:MAG TPA: O-antigen ligase family protein [Burkholderiales bacterium]|nr:O-antigen ligase family protein [Burkholderiales bacterium]
MATLSIPQPRSEAPGRHTWLIAAFALFAGAAAGGYALAVGELEALWAGLSIAACVAVLIDYRLGAILLVLLLPVSATSLFPHSLMKITGLNPINVLIAGTLGAYLLRGRLETPGPLVPKPLAWLYIAPIVFAGVLGTLYVDDIYPGFHDALIVNYTAWPGYLRDELVKPMLTVVAAVLVAGAVAKAPKPEPFIAAVAISACLLAFVMFGFVVESGIRLGSLASARGREFFTQIGTHANQLGRVFVTGYALLLFAWWEAKAAPTRLMLFAALGILSFGIVLTFSRNAFLGFMVVNALFLVWKFNMKKLGLAVLGFTVAAALAPEAVYRRISYGFDAGANEVSAGRIDGIWLPLLPETLKSPLWGNGLGSVMWSDAMNSRQMEFVGHPHNAYLEAVLDMGLIGLALILFFYWRVWKGFLELGSNAYLTPLTRGFFQGACAALIAFLVAGMTGGSLRPDPENILLWMAIGIMFGLLARRPAS